MSYVYKTIGIARITPMAKRTFILETDPGNSYSKKPEYKEYFSPTSPDKIVEQKMKQAKID